MGTGSARSAVLGLVFLLCVAFLAPGEARQGRTKLARSGAKSSKKVEHGKVYGDRRPWEDRQDTYDWEFMGVSEYGT